MAKSDLIILKLEIDNSIKYIRSRKEKITIGEVLQELGNIKLIVNNLIDNSKSYAKTM
jgi:hypothetical protein